MLLLFLAMTFIVFATVANEEQTRNQTDMMLNSTVTYFDQQEAEGHGVPHTITVCSISEFGEEDDIFSIVSDLSTMTSRRG